MVPKYSIDTFIEFVQKYLINGKLSPAALLLYVIAVNRKDLRGNTLPFTQRLLTLWKGKGKVGSAWLFCIVAHHVNKFLHAKLVDVSPRRKIVWRNEVVVVTGGARGIGGDLVDKLARRGAKVAVLDVIPPQYRSPKPIYIKTDITSTESILAAQAEIKEKFGDATMLVNCAGLGRGASAIEGDEKPFLDDVINVNLLGTIKVIRTFAPAMIAAKKGHIMTISSGAAYISLPFMTSYCASKAGILAFHESFRGELLAYHRTPGVRTSLIHPLKVETEMTKGVLPDVKNQFFAPNLTAAYVSTRMLEALEKDTCVQLLLPNVTYALLGLRSLPQWMTLGPAGSGAARKELSTHVKLLSKTQERIGNTVKQV